MMPLVLLVILTFVALVALSMVRISEQISGPRQLSDRASRHQLCELDEHGNLNITDPDGRKPERMSLRDLTPAFPSWQDRDARPVMLLKDRWPAPPVHPRPAKPSPTVIEA